MAPDSGTSVRLWAGLEASGWDVSSLSRYSGPAHRRDPQALSVCSPTWGCVSVVCRGFPARSAGKESACDAGDLASVPALGRPPGGGKGDPLQYSGLESGGSQRVGHDWAGFTHSLTLSRFMLSNNVHIHLCTWIAVCFPHGCKNLHL